MLRYVRSARALLCVAFASCSSDGGSGASTDDGLFTATASDSSTTEATSTSTGATSTSTDATGASSTSEASTGNASSSSTTGEPAQCPTFADGIDGGSLADASINEASGLAVSRTQDNVLWVHNDSGDSPRLFAIGADGALRGEFTIIEATAVDWEDMALGPGPTPNVDDIYIADFGDNSEARPSVTIWRVPEPDVAASGPGPTAVADAEALEFTYPDGPHDAETLLSDPETGNLFIVAKDLSGASPVFRLAAPHDPDTVAIAEQVTTVDFGAAPLPGSPLTTGGDVSPAGDLIAIRTYTHAFAWRRGPGMTLAEALETDPCALPLEFEIQGETFAFGPDAQAYFTVSEGTSSSVWRYDRNP